MKQNDITTIEQFEKVVNDIQFGRISFIGEYYQELYRGQTKESYKLESGISRHVNSAKEMKELEKIIIDDFKKLINASSEPRKFIQLALIKQQNFENEWRWIEQIQHYGLPTRLLDWSINPYIALFFAVNNHPNDNGQFWIYKSPTNWSCDEHFELNPYAENLNIISNSSFYIENDYMDKIAEQRRSFQSGKFTIQDYNTSITALENQDNINKNIIKHNIPAECKASFLDYLSEEKNINTETVYVRYDNEIMEIISKIKSKYNI